MAEAGPSSPRLSTKPHPATPPRRPSGRIHFPVDNSQQNNAEDEPQTRVKALGLGPAPLIRGADSGGSLNFRRDDKRRRVQSVDLVKLAEHTPPPPPQNSRRTLSMSRRSEKRAAIPEGVSSGLLDTFSDEFDLYPGVLEDVQRALKMKARREARIKSLPSNLPHPELHTVSDGASGSSYSGPSSPVRPFVPLQHLRDKTRFSGESEIDFRPATGSPSARPVPASLDGGKTLDWTTTTYEEESGRPWTLSITKRKPKDKPSQLPDRSTPAKDAASHMEKLHRIKSQAKQTTLRKAAITSDQLERKYHLLGSSDAKGVRANLIDVKRWHRAQDPQMQASMGQLEPLTWMRHLQNSERTMRSLWSPTALVMEEYVKSTTVPHSLMDTIPEDEIARPTPYYQDSRSISSSIYSRPSPRHSLDQAMSRVRSAYGDGVSFEPVLESGPDSVDPRHRHSADDLSRPAKSTHRGSDSARSSIYSLLNGASPNSSRKRLHGLTKRLGGLSDDVPSSARNSISDHEPSASDDGGIHKPRRSRPASLILHPSSEQLPSSLFSPASKGFENGHAASSSTAVDGSFSAALSGTTAEPTPRPQENVEPQLSHPPIPRRRTRLSLPSSQDVFLRQEEKKQRAADEKKEREEYERKAEILEETLSQNYRNRHHLQRVSTRIREFDSVQASLAGLLGTAYSKIPSEVLEAFAHDPCAVTSDTRSLKSWRAVEDIHGRIRKQQEVLQAFALSLSTGEGTIVPEHNVFDEPVSSLMETLEQLAKERHELLRRSEEMAEVLKRVKDIHGTVKQEYNDAMAQTSLVYPQLSHIAALEESYWNQYQQFWDIGLDALTFLLDTVTPFWRNYGKVIGQDIQDFLIIPWYRNEFTGEPKRYRIKKFPRRSFRHWIGLFFLSFLTVFVTLLQMRAAATLTVNYNLPWISHSGLWGLILPFYIIGLIIQWCAVLIECCVLLAQSGIVIWWAGWTVNLVT